MYDLTQQYNEFGCTRSPVQALNLRPVFCMVTHPVQFVYRGPVGRRATNYYGHEMSVEFACITALYDTIVNHWTEEQATRWMT